MDIVINYGVGVNYFDFMKAISRVVNRLEC